MTSKNGEVNSLSVFFIKMFCFFQKYAIVRLVRGTIMKKVFLILFLLVFSSQSSAGFAEGEMAFNEQRYPQAFSEFYPLAETGDFRSQYYIGYLYLNGYGVTQDTKKAVSFLEKAVAQDYDMAEALMGFLYSEGIGVSKNKKKAITLYEKAAAKGNASAMVNLGVAYYSGDGVGKNVKKAVEYFSKVSPAQQPVVAKYLGDIYLNDKSMYDANKAMNYYIIAARAGDVGAYHALGYMTQNGIGTNRSIPDAMKFYLYAAAQGYAPSQYALGVIYANGEGTITQDKFKAYAWFTLAAEQQMPQAVQAKEALTAGMSLSERDKANRALIDIQQADMKQADSPIQAIETAEKIQDQPVKKTTVRRRRR